MSRTAIAGNVSATHCLDPEEEGASYLGSKTKYIPIFSDYLRKNDLEARVRYECDAVGPDHAKTWTCALYGE